MYKEKLELITNNMPKVYEAGQEAGGGSSSDDGAFWDLYQQNGNRKDYSYGFCGVQSWTDQTFRPKYDVTPNRAGYMFCYAGITDLPAACEAAGIRIDFSGLTSNSYCLRPFHYSKISHVGEVDLTRGSGAYNTFFASDTAASSELVTIDLLKLPASGALTFGTNFFQNCVKLANIRVEGLINSNIPSGACPFTTESIQSIIDCLADRTGSSALTWTVSATAYNNMTQAQKDAVSAKNWNLAQA